MPLLVASQVTKRFGGLQAVRKLEYQIDEGSLVFDGQHIERMRPDQIADLGIARTYQNIRLFTNVTTIENVLIGQHRHLRSSWIASVLGTRGVHTEEREALEEARRLLKFSGLRRKGDVLAGKLPYGDQRRLEIARALATKPRLLLLDEPTAGMNPAETGAMMTFIRNLRDDLGVTILLIEHEMRVVMGISERITVLDYGEKIAEGTPKEIQANERVIEGYLGRGYLERQQARANHGGRPADAT